MTLGRETADGTARAAAYRPAALVLLLAFAGGIFASAAGIHGCPQHRHAAPGRAAPPAAAPGPSDGPGTSGGERSSDRERPDRTCTCLGDCQTGVPNAIHPSSARDLVRPDAWERLQIAAAPTLRSAPRSEYFLPYPLGPPAA